MVVVVVGRGGGQVSQLERVRGPRPLPPALPQHKKQCGHAGGKLKPTCCPRNQEARAIRCCSALCSTAPMAGRRINDHCYARSGRDDAVGHFRDPEGPCPAHEMDSRRRRGRWRLKYWFPHSAQERARYVCKDFDGKAIGLNVLCCGRCENKGPGRTSTSARACGPHGLI